MANLLVPTFIWYGAPEHTISSILVLPDTLTTSSGGKTIMATGSITGHICIWDIQRKKPINSINPRIFMTCQEPSPVIALLSTTYDWKESLISVTTDGTVAIFSVCDGQCLATRPSSFKCEPTCVRLINSRYLAAGGRTSELEILDLNTRKVVRRIEGHNTWIRSMVSFTFGTTSVLGTLTGSGFIRFWEISEDLFTKPKKLTANTTTPPPTQPIIDTPLQEIELEFQDSRTISVSPNNTLLMVLCLSKWVVYWIWGKHHKLLMSIPMPNSSAICGHFIDDNTIAIWSKNGAGYIYAIPKQITEDVKNLCQEKSVPTSEEEQNSQNKTVSVIKDLEPKRILRLTAKENSVKYLNTANTFCSKDLMAIGFDEGFICMWDLPLPQGSEQEQLFPNYVGDFAHGFWSTEPGPLSLCRPSGPTVTASLLLETEFSLINGYSDGTVSIRKLPSDAEPISWMAHDAKVNCILFIRTTTTKSDYIITGSDDFYVKVWSLQTQKLVNRFSCHAGRVRSLHYNGHPGIPHLWKNRFFSVGEDRSVILYQLDSEKGIKCVFGGHPSQISDVKWNVEQDYLIVECTDGSVSVWEMETGELEQRLYGKTAVDIFNNANPLSKAEKYEKIKSVNKQAITGITIDGQQIGYSAPVQAIVFNIKILSTELCKQLQELQQNPDSEVSLNDLPTFNAYTYLLPWGFDENLEYLVRTELLLKRPDPAVSYGLMGSTGRMGILVPSASIHARWSASPTLTALHTLSTVSLSKALLPFRNNANACSQILSHVCALIPERVVGYVDPSLSFLARYWQDPLEDTMQSSRTIFVSVIDRLSLQARQGLARSWSVLLQSPDESDSSKKTKSLAVLVLGILGAERPDSLTAEISNQVTTSIMDLLFQEDSEKLRVAAVELLGKGFGEWSKHIKDVNQIIIKLFKLSILPDQKLLTTTAHHALMLIGAREPLQFLRALGRPMQQGAKGNEVVPNEHSLALHTIGALVKKHPVSLLTTLPLLVESVVRSLDPHVPYLRNACLKSATTLVHDLVRRYPMIAFHQLSQRLAVGTRDGSILIYDLISATRWFTLEGHKHEVSAVSFENDGNFLASYSIQDAAVKIWRASAGFFGILGSNPSCYKTIPVSPATKVITPSQLLEPMVKLQWTGTKEFILVRLWEDEAHNYVVLKRT